MLLVYRTGRCHGGDIGHGLSPSHRGRRQESQAAAPGADMEGEQSVYGMISG